MFENITTKDILDTLLSHVDDSLDKRESSLIYTALAAYAIEMMQNYLNLDYVANQAFIDTADREHLVRRAKEMGIMPKTATTTTVKARFDIDVPQGTRFTALISGYRFYVNTLGVLDESDGYYYATLNCETVGTLDDESFVGSALIPIDAAGKTKELEGLTVSEIVSIIERGKDEEDTETFRKRYYKETQWEHYGGNIADYKMMLSTTNGVGMVKVIPLAQGPGTVELIVADSALKKPSDELIANWQEIIDPVGLRGLGYGKAPIDHRVTVTGVKEKAVNVSMSLTYETGQTWNTVKDNVQNAIENYLSNVRNNWENSDGLTVRVAHIESAVLDVNGIVDIANTKINSSASNITVDGDSIPVLGTVTVS